MQWWKTVLLSCLVFLVCILVLAATAGVFSWLSFRAMVKGDTVGANQYLRVATPIVSGFSTLSFDQSNTVGCWQSALELMALLSAAPSTLQEASESYSTRGSVQLAPLQTLVSDADGKLDTVIDCLNANAVLQRVVSAKKRGELHRQVALAQTAVNAIKLLFGSNQTWVVMFQNTTELRPTGGFTGSYALIELRDNELQTLAVEDIYDADGQVQRFRDAPAGIRQYTSGDNGLRLPDANWWPDFPTSAQTQLDFLAEAGKKNLTGLVALNLTLLQNILLITGPIALPDYQLTLDAENAPLLLRSHAQGFFPGSREKKQLLSYALQQLQYQLATMNSGQKRELVEVLLRAAATKDIQVFSTNPEQQTALTKLGLAAALDPTSTPILAVVEANVGINKSNQFITRTMSVHQDGDDLVVTLHLKNSAEQLAPSLPASASGYVNYQRIVTSSALSVTKVATNTNKPPIIATETWTTDAGATFTEQGFLLTILPGQTQTVTVHLLRADRAQPLLLWHQSGIGNTQLTVIESSGETKTRSFDQDLLITP